MKNAGQPHHSLREGAAAGNEVTAARIAPTPRNLRLPALSGLCLIAVAACFAVAAPAAFAAPLFDARIDYNTGLSPQSAISADFNGDDKADLATANSSSHTVSILLGNGDGGFEAENQFPTGSFPSSVTSEDFNGDQKPDLAVTNENADTVSILLGNGDGGFAAKTDFPSGSTPLSIATGYFNADNHPDLVTANFNSRDIDTDGTVSVLLGTGDGSFGPQTEFEAVFFYPSSVVSDDFNGDDKADLAVTDAGNATLSILLGAGDGSFGPKTYFDAPLSPDYLISEDFNLDGDPDLAVTSTFSTGSLFPVSILLGAGDGTLGEPTEFGAGEETSSVTSADFNGDSKPDLATANLGPGPDFGTGSVSVLLGDGGGSFGPKTDFTTGPQPNSVTSADFNSDGKPDLATSNYDFSKSTVSVLLGNGTPDPVVAPADVGFGTQTLGTTSSTRKVAVTNPPPAYPLLVGQVTVTGPDADDFIVDAGNCAGMSVASSDSCEISVSFAPSAAGDREARLELSHDGSSSPLIVPLSGTGEALPPDPPTAPARIGKVKVSGPKKVKKGKKASYELKISNSGSSAANGVKLKVSGKGIKLTKKVGSIAAGKTKAVKVKVRFKKPGRIKATFKVSSGNAGGKTIRKMITVRK